MQNELLEQYKLYVEMADRIIQRRHATNRFYISLLTGLGGLYLLLYKTSDYPNALLWVIITAVISLLWWINIYYYRQLNSGKFKVIFEMEQQLPFACYDREWEILGRGKHNRLYLNLSKVESYIPFTLIILCLTYIGYRMWFI